MTTTLSTAQAITATSVADGGGTFDQAGRAVTSGVAVTTLVFAKEQALDERDVRSMLALLDDDGAYLGTWYDEENGAWEISETAVFANRDDAMTLARSLGERYVYDLDANECLPVA